MTFPWPNFHFNAIIISRTPLYNFPFGQYNETNGSEDVDDGLEDYEAVRITNVLGPMPDTHMYII